MSIPIKNQTYLATEVIQVKNKHSPQIMKEIFVLEIETKEV